MKHITRPSRSFRADGPTPDALVRAPLMAGVKGKNQMYECPHCEKQTIRANRKLMAGKTTPAICPQCGGKSHPDIKSAMTGLVVLNLVGLGIAVLAVVLDALWLLSGVFVLAVVSVKIFVLNKPMTKVG